MNKKICSAL